jgi:hypothetical protein
MSTFSDWQRIAREGGLWDKDTDGQPFLRFKTDAELYRDKHPPESDGIARDGVVLPSSRADWGALVSPRQREAWRANARKLRGG